jgi:hypothetical protein
MRKGLVGVLPERFRAQHIAHRRNYAQNTRVRPMGNGLDLFARRNDGSDFKNGERVTLNPPESMSVDVNGMR